LTLARLGEKRATLLSGSLKQSRDALATATSRVASLEHDLARAREAAEATVRTRKAEYDARVRFLEQTVQGLKEQLSSLRARTAADDVSREQQQQQQQQLAAQAHVQAQLALSGGGGSQLSLSGWQLSVSAASLSGSPSRAPPAGPPAAAPSVVAVAAAAGADGDDALEHSRLDASGSAGSGGEEEGGGTPRQSLTQLVRALQSDTGACGGGRHQQQQQSAAARV
jgi:hypothetical protein